MSLVLNTWRGGIKMHVNFQLPVKGLHLGGSVEQGPAMTSGHMNNVRARCVLENKVRIGQRPGLDKWYGTQIGGAEAPVVCMCSVSTVS